MEEIILALQVINLSIQIIILILKIYSYFQI